AGAARPRASPHIRKAHMNQPIIEIEGLSHNYEALHPAIHDVSLSVREGSWVAIAGPNGAGKTTLVKHINALLKPSAGRVQVAGIDTRDMSVADMARHVGYVFQNPDHQIFCATCREEIAFGPRNLGQPEPVVRARTQEALAWFGLEPWADHPPALLSYGQRRLVALASVLAMQPEILILDEPTVGLDAVAADELLRRIQERHCEGRTIILVTHDIALAARYAEEMVVMADGHVLIQDDVRHVLTQPELLRQGHLEPPPITALCQTLAHLGLPGDVLTVSEAAKAILDRLERRPWR
ncbi:MAG: energy-coupling factor ABC transporter ATP-binding protein, partial [Anaerolineae bacterium]